MRVSEEVAKELFTSWTRKQYLRSGTGKTEAQRSFDELSARGALEEGRRWLRGRMADAYRLKLSYLTNRLLQHRRNWFKGREDIGTNQFVKMLRLLCEDEEVRRFIMSPKDETALNCLKMFIQDVCAVGASEEWGMGNERALGAGGTLREFQKAVAAIDAEKKPVNTPTNVWRRKQRDKKLAVFAACIGGDYGILDAARDLLGGRHYKHLDRVVGSHLEYINRLNWLSHR